MSYMKKKKKDVDGKQENIYIKNQQIMNKINKKNNTLSTWIEGWY